MPLPICPFHGDMRCHARIARLQLFNLRCDRFLHLIIPHENFSLLSGKDNQTSYRFGSGQAEHLFCKTCGVKTFYQPRSHPNAWSVNYNCLDVDHGLAPSIRKFDGRNWNKAKAGLK